jgi:two-component system chemotaxis response regulator CheB
MIVIGASAGGIQALQEIVSALPRDFAACVLIVVHTAAEDGYLAQVLGRSSRLPSLRAEHGMRIDTGRLYVAPPDHHLTVVDSRALLSRGPKVNRHRPAIDPLFESAAEAYGNRLIGIVLSGYLDDGTAGLAAVKANGGIAIVQDPSEALAPNMPRNAMRKVKVDYCVPLAEIAPLLVRLVNGNTRKRNRRE